MGSQFVARRFKRAGRKLGDDDDDEWETTTTPLPDGRPDTEGRKEQPHAPQFNKKTQLEVWRLESSADKDEKLFRQRLEVAESARACSYYSISRYAKSKGLGCTNLGGRGGGQLVSANEW